ncbi:hypothetical protein [Empedobacter falsenii]
MECNEQNISPYLPFGVKFISSMDNSDDTIELNKIWTLDGINKLFGDYCLLTKENNDAYDIKSCKLLLRPLSDLTKEIDHNGERFVPLDELTEGCTVRFSLPNYAEDWDSRTYYSFDKYIEEWINGDVHHLNFIPFGFIQKLYEWHFDLQRLIEKGLAVDINTLNQ